MARRSKTSKTADTPKMEVFYLDPSEIVIAEEDRGRQQKPTKSDIDALAQSMKSDGQLQPARVRKNDDGKWQMVFGFTRREAAIANKQQLAVTAELENVSEVDAFIHNIHENLVRKSVTPMDTANNLKRLKDQFGMNNRQIAKAVGLSEQYVGKLLIALELPASIQRLIRDGKLAVGPATALSTVPEEELEGAIKELLDRMKEDGRESIRRGDISDWKEENLESEVDDDGKRSTKRAGKTLKQIKDFIQEDLLDDFESKELGICTEAQTFVDVFIKFAEGKKGGSARALQKAFTNCLVVAEFDPYEDEEVEEEYEEEYEEEEVDEDE